MILTTKMNKLTNNNNVEDSQPNCFFDTDYDLNEWDDDDYILDTGTSTNMYRRKANLVTKWGCNRTPIYGLGEMTTNIKGGHTDFGEGLVLPNEYSGPNLIAWRNLIKRFYVHLWNDQGFVFTSRSAGGPNYVAFMDERNLFPLVKVKKQSIKRLTERRELVLLATHLKARQAKILHELLGHPNAQYMEQAIQNGEYEATGISAEDIRAANLDECRGCRIGKMTGRHPISKVKLSNPKPKIGEHMHADLIYVILRRNKYLLYFMAVDEATGYVYSQWIYNKKPESMLHAIKSMRMFFKSYTHEVKFLHTDPDSSLCSKEAKYMFDELGIQHVTTSPDIHEKIAERKVRTIKNSMRATYHNLEYQLPAFLIKDLFEATVQGLNDTPNSKTDGMTATYHVTGNKVDGRHFQVPFGTVGDFHEPYHNTTFSKRSRLGIMVGRKPNTRAMKVFLLEEPYEKVDRGKFVERDKIEPLALPLPSKTVEIINSYATHDPVVFNDDTLIRLETEPKREIKTLNSDIQIEGELSLKDSVNRTSFSNERTSDDGADSLSQDLVGPTCKALPAQNPLYRTVDVNDTLVGLENVTSQTLKGVETNAAANNNSSTAGPMTEPNKADIVKDQESAMANEQGGHLGERNVISSVSDSNKRAAESDAEGESGQRKLGRSKYGRTYMPSKKYTYFGRLAKQAAAYAFLTSPDTAGDSLEARQKKSAKLELQQMIDYDVFLPVKLEELTKDQLVTAIKTRMLFDEKYGPDGVFIKDKSRLVVKGYMEILPPEYDVNSPTVSLESVQLGLNLAALENYDIDIYDIKGAFLEATLDRDDVYAVLDSDLRAILLQMDPKYKVGETTNGKLIVKLRKALYGLKESPLKWYETMKKALIEAGFVGSRHDRGLFYKKTEHGKHLVLLHVDDILSTGPKESMAQLREYLKKRFKTVVENVNPGKFKYLGMVAERNRSERSIKLTQPKYINAILKELQIQKDEICKTPCNDKLFTVSDSETLDEVQAKQYRRQVMRMMYIAIRTRPDIRLAVGFLSTRMQMPTKEDWFKLYKVAMYLNGTQELAFLVKPDSLDLYVSADASHGMHTDRKSHTGGLLWLGKTNAPIKTVCTKQKLVSRSSFEAELIAVDDLGNQAIWMRNILKELDLIQDPRPILIEQDNKSCIMMATKGPGNGKSRSVDIKYFWITEQIEQKVLALKYVPSTELLADGFTKSLPLERFIEWRRRIMNIQD
jgi:hypothetical protein